MATIAINLGHPLAEHQIKQLQALVGGDVQVHVVPVQIDMSSDIGAQIDAIARQVVAVALEFTRVIVIPPGMSLVAMKVASALTAALEPHQRFELAVVKRREGAVATVWDITELI